MKRLPIRKIREVLRLKLEHNLSEGEKGGRKRTPINFPAGVNGNSFFLHGDF